MSFIALTSVNNSLADSTASYAAAAAAAATRPASPGKYVPVHRRHDGDTSSQRSVSPTPSDASTSTLVSSTSPSTKPRVYSIATLLHLSHEPEIRVIAMEQKEKLKEALPEIVMNRKMRKALEYHAIQERIRAKAQAQTKAKPQTKAANNPPSKKPNSPYTQSTPNKPVPSQQQQKQRPRQQMPSRASAEKRRNANKAPEAGWRGVRLPAVAAV
ncbi:hypothetical protein P691DRAFT_777144 [Macrolepiota fuliginosa MF-IS2]|uniref:Uncharacterized protein n=1 Tax=Macrolepiota fuliginosa MF-IS2 TaxID=1400762 RepID=A0A9P5X717_9AGAR|nr:hypothetical protein P691DRAFT_777144 [Macrolepiota fuliginosa MF-IS2]